jgi:DNA (cytosine-5)-methyltransferase 1
MKYRSVCTGIAAETVAWHPLGWTPLSFSEIDPFCCSLLTHHYPEVRNYGDFTKIQAEGLESTDLLMGGTPCQSFSIAGKRAGLDDPRGNLALEFIRLADRLKPRWIVWENVPGVLSMDENEAIQIILDSFARIGYVCDIDILDAQCFGLAQRRERIFVVCLRVEDLLKTRTCISDRIMAELLAQALLSTWAEARQALYPERSPLDCGFRIGGLNDSPGARMELLDALLGGSAVTRLLDYWAAALPRSTSGPNGSASVSHPHNGTPSRESRMATAGFQSSKIGNDAGLWNIGKSWQMLLEEIYSLPKNPTTSTLTAPITAEGISSFAKHAAVTVEFIISSETSSLSQKWSSDSWNLAFSLLTLAQDLIDYAASASCELFSKDSIRDDWWNCEQSARAIVRLIEQHTRDWATLEQILSQSKSLRRDTAPGRKAGQEVAGTIGGSSQNGGFQTTDLDSTGAFVAIAPCMPSGGNRTGGPRHPGSGPETATSLVAFLPQGLRIQNPSDPAQTLASNPAGGNKASPIHVGSAVRRLAPKEWERLMGFQDDYTLIPYPRLKLAADSPRYKAIGNSISVPTLRWIGRRIQTVEAILAKLYTK